MFKMICAKDYLRNEQDYVGENTGNSNCKDPVKEAR